jgi:hypothetical protein
MLLGDLRFAALFLSAIRWENAQWSGRSRSAVSCPALDADEERDAMKG